MNKESRTKRISELIDSSSRCATNVNIEELYGCDVCFTCKWFYVLTNECRLTDEDVMEIVPHYFGSADGIKVGYYDAKTIIKNPAFYRCFIWESKDGQS